MCGEGCYSFLGSELFKLHSVAEGATPRSYPGNIVQYLCASWLYLVMLLGLVLPELKFGCVCIKGMHF